MGTMQVKLCNEAAAAVLVGMAGRLCNKAAGVVFPGGLVEVIWALRRSIMRVGMHARHRALSRSFNSVTI